MRKSLNPSTYFLLKACSALLICFVTAQSFALTEPIPPATPEQISGEWIGVYSQSLWRFEFRKDGAGKCERRFPAGVGFSRSVEQYRVYSWKAEAGKVRFACRGVEGTAGRWLFEADFLPFRGRIKDAEWDANFEVIPAGVLKEVP